MTFILKRIFRLIRFFVGENGTTQLAFGVTFGWILGLSPFVSLQSLLILLLILFFRVQVLTVIISYVVFSLIAYIFDPVFHSVGCLILEVSFLKSLYTLLYNMPIIPFTKFNNSVVMGSGVFAILLSPVIFFLTKFIMKKYRQTILARIKNTKLCKMLESTFLFKWYYKYDELY